MHDEEDPAWGNFAAACIRRIGEISQQIHEDEVREKNRTDLVFTKRSGGEQILWESRDGKIVPPVNARVGWQQTFGVHRRFVVYSERYGWNEGSEEDRFDHESDE